MAELIPAQYRVRVAQKAVLLRSVVYGVVILAGVAVGAFYAWNWQRKQASALADLQNDYRQRSTLIESAKDMRKKWQDLQQRRARIAQLRDDSTLLSLLNHVSQATREYDCLEQVQIDARKSSSGEKDSYFVKLTGVTADPAGLAAYMKRLSEESKPPINVILESSKREQFLDGHVLRFHILCERPQG
jgi:hypothetical protein